MLHVQVLAEEEDVEDEEVGEEAEVEAGIDNRVLHHQYLKLLSSSSTGSSP